MVALADVILEGDYLSLAKLAGRKIKDVKLYITVENGTPMLVISNIILEDGIELGVEGEHDCPYLDNPYPKDADKLPNLSEDNLEFLRTQKLEADGICLRCEGSGIVDEGFYMPDPPKCPDCDGTGKSGQK
jgi:hypothetical protein